MLACEQRAFAKGIGVAELIDRVGYRIAQALHASFSEVGTIVAYVGKGHNAADAFVALTYLSQWGWDTWIEPAYSLGDVREETQKKWTVWQSREPFIKSENTPKKRPLVFLDALLGIGASGDLKAPIRPMAARLMREARENQGMIISLDVPSGMCANTGKLAEGGVHADMTLCVGAVKKGLLEPCAQGWSGAVECVRVEGIEPMERREGLWLNGKAGLIDLLPLVLPTQSKWDNKKIGIVAGSRGMLGAAQLASMGALRAGGGLVTLFCLEESYPFLAASMPSEVMVRPVKSYLDLLDFQMDSWGIGPGLGREKTACLRLLLEQLKNQRARIVLDADGLFSISPVCDILPAEWICTPHAGEMARLCPELCALSPLEQAQVFARKNKACLLLKGVHSQIIQQGKGLFVNTTGHGGMATGGMGDVLCGILATFLAQGIDPFHAARLGAWVLGRSAQRRIYLDGIHPRTLLPRDVLEGLGGAFYELDSLRTL